MLILLFTYTGLSKLSGYGFFKSQLSLYPVLNHFTGLLPWALPAAELIISALLFIPAYRIYGFWCSAIILCVFTGYLIVMVLYKSNLPCSCGGVIKNLSWKQHIIFNLFFLALSVTGIILKKSSDNISHISKRELRFSA